jgi:hypothetical protein
MAMETMLSVLYMTQEHVALSSRLWTVSQSTCEFTMFRRTGLYRAGQVHTRVTLYPSKVAPITLEGRVSQASAIQQCACSHYQPFMQQVILHETGSYRLPSCLNLGST